VSGSSVSFRVTSLKDITSVIFPHFYKYPLITQKKADYLLYKQAVLLIAEKKHLTEAGFQEILNIKASINLGLSEELFTAFPKTVAIDRPLVESTEIPPYSMVRRVRFRGRLFQD